MVDKTNSRAKGNWKPLGSHIDNFPAAVRKQFDLAHALATQAKEARTELNAMLTDALREVGGIAPGKVIRTSPPKFDNAPGDWNYAVFDAAKTATTKGTSDTETSEIFGKLASTPGKRRK